MLLLLGCTALMILSLMVLTGEGYSNFERALAIIGVSVGGVMCVLGWTTIIIDLYEKGKLFRFKCK